MQTTFLINNTVVSTIRMLSVPAKGDTITLWYDTEKRYVHGLVTNLRWFVATDSTQNLQISLTELNYNQINSLRG